MMNKIMNFFRKNEEKELEKYTGFADFFLHAPTEEKKKVITEAAKKANEDQFRILKESRLRTRRS